MINNKRPKQAELCLCGRQTVCGGDFEIGSVRDRTKHKGRETMSMRYKGKLGCDTQDRVRLEGTRDRKEKSEGQPHAIS